MKEKNITRLEAARHSAGLTRKELSELSGVKYRTIEAYEQRKNNLNEASVSTVRDLAAALKIPIEKILEP